MESVLAALRGGAAGLSINEFLSRVNIRRGRIDKALQLMSLESPAPVVKQGSKWLLTAANLAEGFWQRAERLTELRRVEQGQMQEYVGLTSGHMEFLIRALDGDPGTYRVPNIAPLPVTLTNWRGKRWPFCGARVYHWIRAGNGQPAGLQMYGCGAKRCRPAGATRSSALHVGRCGLGFDWCVREKRTMDGLQISWLKHVRPWCEVGRRNPAPGWVDKYSFPAGIQIWCRTLHVVWPPP